jgi:hypothetical protein
MAFCKLLGITLPVAEQGSGTITLAAAGERGRTFSNTPYSDVRAESQDYAGRTVLRPRSTSLAYRLLVNGEGNAWRFNKAGTNATAQTYSTKGLVAASVEYDNSILSVATGGPVAGSGYLNLSYAATVVWAMKASPLLQSTMVAWVRNLNFSEDWIHYVVEIGPGHLRMWEDGAEVFDSADFTIPLGIDGWCGHPTLGPYVGKLVLGIAVENDEPTDVGEMMVLPYCTSLLEEGWAAWHYNGGAGRRAEPDCRTLSMAGTWPETGTDEVDGEVGSQQLATTGADTVYESFDFTLRSSRAT